MSAPEWYRPPGADIQEGALASWQPSPDDTVGFGARAAVRLVDSVLSLGVAQGVAAVVLHLGEAGVSVPQLDSHEVAFGAPAQLRVGMGVSIALAFAVGALTDVIADAIGGATLGKLLFGYRVRAIDGGVCSVGAAFKRAVAYVWDAVFFGMVAYTAMRRSAWNQRVGDRWAKTIVVRNAAIPEPSRISQRAILGALISTAVSTLYSLFVEIVYVP